MNGQDARLSLEAFLAGTADGVSAVDSNGVIVGWNAAAEKLLGQKADEAIGRRCRDVFDARDAAGNLCCSEFCTVRNHAARCEPLHHFEIKTKTRAGDPISLDVSGVVLGNEPDTPIGWILLFREATRPREVQSNLKEQMPAMPARLKRPSPRTLTRRERQILSLMREGATTDAIAERFSISHFTVRNHLQKMFTKLDVHNRLEAVALANRYDL